MSIERCNAETRVFRSGLAPTQNVQAQAERGDEISCGHRNGRVFVVERSSLLRDCLAQTVAAGFGVEVSSCAHLSDIDVGEAASPIVLLSLLSTDTFEAQAELETLADMRANARAVVLGRSDDPAEAWAAVSNGAKGYISASSNFEMFILALKCVAAGGGYVSTSCFDDKHATRIDSAGGAACGITVREMEVIRAIRQGKPNKIIAYDLGVCEGTVKAHIRHIMKKLGSKNRTEIALKGLGSLSRSGA